MEPDSEKRRQTTHWSGIGHQGGVERNETTLHIHLTPAIRTVLLIILSVSRNWDKKIPMYNSMHRASFG